MADTSKQDKARQEDLMAGGPVSRGAENQDAPVNRDKRKVRSTQRPPDTTSNPNRQEGGEPEHSSQPAYNKMNIDRTSGTREGSGMETDRHSDTMTWIQRAPQARASENKRRDQEKSLAWNLTNVW